MTRTLLVDNATVVTLGEHNRVLPGHAVACRDGRIEAIARAGSLPGPFDLVVDAAGRVAMPGFVNAHMHFYSTFARGLGKVAPSRTFVEVLEHLWWRLDKRLTLEDCEVSALVALVAAVRAGTTTLIDHHASPFAARGSLERIAAAVRQVGLKAALCYEVSDRDGPDVARAGLEENASFLRAVAGGRDRHLRALFGLHASFTLTDGTLAEATRLGGDAGFHVHVAEALSDQEHAQRTYGERVVARLKRLGVLGPRSIAAHCVHVDRREMDLLAETGTAVVHNPQSNMNNAVGVADVPELLRRGVLVGLGTDAMTVDMREEVRAALFVRHLTSGDPQAAFVETLGTLLRGGPAIASRYFEPGVGELAPGLAADLVLLDYDPPTPLDADTFLGHFAFGLYQAPVDTTIAGGRVLMHHRELRLDLDEARLAARSRELARALWERF